MKIFSVLLLSLSGTSALADVPLAVLPQIAAADIFVVGEIHDNPVHHLIQAQLASTAAAIVFEMLTPEQAERGNPDLTQDKAALEAALGWNASGWPDFSMYYPIFQAGAGSAIFGAAVPRETARNAMVDGLAAAFGAGATDYGLTETLTPDTYDSRIDLQRKAHCGALPEEVLPAMVDIQRLRDARLAQIAMQAFDQTGGPVIVITGNGHARADWGVPKLLHGIRPDLRVFTILQGEDGEPPEGEADLILTQAAAVERPDPCLAFTK